MKRAARDLMQRKMGIVDATATLAELERAFREAGVSGFPVVDGGRVVGVVSRTDVLRRLGATADAVPRPSSFYGDLANYGRDPEPGSLARAASRSGRSADEVCVADLMTASVINVGPDASLQEVARTLVEQRVHRVLVIDDGTLVGVVSSLDLVRLIAEDVLR